MVRGVRQPGNGNGIGMIGSKQPPRRRRTWSGAGWRSAPGVALAAGIAAGWLLPVGPLAAQQGPPPVPVETAPVRIEAVADRVASTGSLRSNESVVIRPEIAGRIVAIHFAEGSAVDAGAPLFSLDATIYEAELAQAEANLNLSQRNYERTNQLSRKDWTSERAMDEARSALERDRAATALVRARLAKTRIPAPFSGLIGLRKVSVGDYVVPGQDLVNFESLEPIKVDFGVPERHLARLARGQRVAVHVDAFPGRTFDGEILAVDPLIDAGGRSIAVRAAVPNPQQLLRPGLFARVEVTLAVRPQAITIPEEAIVPRGNDRLVFRVIDGKAVLTPVETGQRQDGRVEIVAGLGPGDVVVTAGHLKIRDGAAVRAEPPPAGS
jgi:membrane fusion protein (multidrug efflux system)